MIVKQRPPRFVQKKHDEPDHDEEEKEPQAASESPSAPVAHKVGLDEVLQLREELFPTLSYEKTSQAGSPSTTEYHVASSSLITSRRIGVTLSTSDQAHDQKTTVDDGTQHEEAQEKNVSPAVALHRQTHLKRESAEEEQLEEKPPQAMRAQKKSHAAHLQSLDELHDFLKDASREERVLLMAKMKPIFDTLLAQVPTSGAPSISENETVEEPAIVDDQMGVAEETEQGETSLKEVPEEDREKQATPSAEKDAETDEVNVTAFAKREQEKTELLHPANASFAPLSYENILRTQLLPAFEAIIAAPAENRNLTKLVDVVKQIQTCARRATTENEEVYNETMQLLLSEMSHVLLDLPPHTYSSLVLNHEMEQLNREMDTVSMHPEKARYLRRFYRLRNASR